jgi:serine/threonine-protein kinase
MSSSEPPLPATIGRYEVVRLLGEGAMGRVLLAHDPVLDRDVAVKHLRSDLKISREVQKGLVVRMRHEARAAARVSHPNLVTLHDMGEDASVGLFLVFEYIQGPTLKQRLKESRLTPDEVARAARELGDALTEAHAAGILHRDVKPENIMLAKKGAKIADFGIARVPDSTLTHQGGLMGTPAYSAPETFKTGTFSPESDQFSLAASLYEAVSGKRAFPGDDAVAVAAKIATDPPAPIAGALGLSPEVDHVLLRAMAQSPTDRFASCAELGESLALAIATPLVKRPLRIEDVPDGSLSPARAAELPRERRIGQVALGALVVVITAALLLRAALRSVDAAAPIAFSASPSATLAASSPVPARPRPSSPRPPPSHRAELDPKPSSDAPAASASPPSSASATPPSSAADAGADAR